jgi:hypothetical protein
MSGEPGAVVVSRGVRGSRWVVLTGLLPFKKQKDEYDTAFEGALFRDPRRDVPMYVGYILERAEVGLAGPAEQPDWKQISLQSAFGVMRYWGAAGAREVIHPKFLPMRPPQGWPMVFPLPPRTGAVWGDEAAHAPEIPLLADMPESERRGYGGMYPGHGEGEEEGEGEPGADEEGETDEPEGLQPFGPMVGRGMPGAGYAGGASGMGYPGGMPMMPGGGGAMMSGGGGMYEDEMYSDEMYDTYEDESSGGYGGGMPYSSGGMYSGSRSRAPEVVEYQLYRFFDFDVEPGKRYQYRVRVGLFNPNYQVETRFLKTDDLAKDWAILTDWSEASNVVQVPRDSRLVAGAVKPPASFSHEPSAQVIAVTLRPEDGAEASMETTVFRGHLGNFVGKLEQERRTSPYGMGDMDEMMYEGYEEMSGGAMMSMTDEMYEMGGPRRPTTRKTATDEDEEAEMIEHTTELVVLDLIGGQRLHRTDRSLTEPGAVLLVDVDGNLLVQNELDDAEEFTTFHVPEPPKRPRRKKKRPGAGMFSEEGYDMYDEEGGGMYSEEMYSEEGYGGGSRSRRSRGRRSRYGEE